MHDDGDRTYREAVLERWQRDPSLTAEQRAEIEELLAQERGIRRIEAILRRRGRL